MSYIINFLDNAIDMGEHSAIGNDYNSTSRDDEKLVETYFKERGFESVSCAANLKLLKDGSNRYYIYSPNQDIVLYQKNNKPRIVCIKLSDNVKNGCNTNNGQITIPAAASIEVSKCNCLGNPVYLYTVLENANQYFAHIEANNKQLIAYSGGKAAREGLDTVEIGMPNTANVLKGYMMPNFGLQKSNYGETMIASMGPARTLEQDPFYFSYENGITGNGSGASNNTFYAPDLFDYTMQYAPKVIYAKKQRMANGKTCNTYTINQAGRTVTVRYTDNTTQTFYVRTPYQLTKHVRKSTNYTIDDNYNLISATYCNFVRGSPWYSTFLGDRKEKSSFDLTYKYQMNMSHSQYNGNTGNGNTLTSDIYDTVTALLTTKNIAYTLSVDVLGDGTYSLSTYLVTMGSAIKDNKGTSKFYLNCDAYIQCFPGEILQAPTSLSFSQLSTSAPEFKISSHHDGNPGQYIHNNSGPDGHTNFISDYHTGQYPSLEWTLHGNFYLNNGGPGVVPAAVEIRELQHEFTARYQDSGNKNKSGEYDDYIKIYEDHGANAGFGNFVQVKRYDTEQKRCIRVFYAEEVRINDTGDTSHSSYECLDFDITDVNMYGSNAEDYEELIMGTPYGYLIKQ